MVSKKTFCPQQPDREMKGGKHAGILPACKAMKRFHFSWVVCLVGALILLCNSGMPANVLPVYLPFLEETGCSGTQTSMLITIRCFAGFISMFAVTKYYEVLDLKRGLMLCCGVVSAGYFLMSTARSYTVYVIGAAMLGVSYGLGAIVPVSLLMNRWFARRKATAIAICAAGTGLSAMFMPPLVTAVAENVSLSAAFRATGALAIAVMVIVLLVVRSDPAQMGLTPFGAQAEGEEVKKERVYAHRYNLPTHVKWIFLAGMILFGGASMASYSHYAVLFTTGGHPKEIAALCCSLQGGILIGSKFVYGLAVDRIGGRRTSLVFMCILILGTTCCALSPGNAAFMYIGSVLCGIGIPPASVGISVWAVEFSTDDTYARVLRNFQMCYTLGGLMMSTLPGCIYDKTGSYSAAFFLLTGFMVIFTLIVMGVYRYVLRQLKKEAAQA